MNTKLLLLLPLATRGLLLHGQRMPLRLGAVRSRVLMVDVPKTLDNRRKRPEESEVSKYGMDPRELAIEQAGEIFPIPPASVRPGAVGVIENVGQLQAAIDLADAQGGFVAIKFVRDGCAACASTAKLLEDTAKEYIDDGSFYLVNYDESRAFCKQVKIRFVPAAHLYARGTLQAALPLGKKAWDAFYDRLSELKAELRS